MYRPELKGPTRTELIQRERQIRNFNRTKWMDIRYIPTPEMSQFDVKPPNVKQLRFSPSGRIGVSLAAPPDILIDGISVYLLDVFHQLWFAVSMKEDIDFNDIFTYHMVNESNLVLVLVNDNMVLQLIVRIDMEQRKAEYIETIRHEFLPRAVPPQGRHPFRIVYNHPYKHSPIYFNGKPYTCLISVPNSVNNRRHIYLIPRHPLLKDVPIVEFSVNCVLTEQNEQVLRGIAGDQYQSYMMRSAGFVSDRLVHLTPSAVMRLGPLEEATIPVFGVYLTIDLEQLKDVHMKQMRPGFHEEIELDQQQAAALRVVSHPFAKLNEQVQNSCGLEGAFVISRKAFPDHRSLYLRCHILGKSTPLAIKTTHVSWLALHPCGALLQFNQNPTSRQLFVRVVAFHQDSLFALAASRLLFQPDRPLARIEGLHEIVFAGLHPIGLDHLAKKAMGTQHQYKQLIRSIERNLKKRSEDLEKDTTNQLEEEELQKASSPDNKLQIHLCFALLALFIAIFLHFTSINWN